jgi:cardiolipin synthase
MTLIEKLQLNPDHCASVSRAVTRLSEATLRDGNALTLLRNGPATYEDWLTAIKRAQQWVHLENYIFKNDTIGQRFADALSERAAAGVAVRVIYDWWGSLDVPQSFWRQLRSNGVDVRVINPLTVGAPLQAVNRDHRKSLGVDGVYASVGGVCIADEWLERSPINNLPYRDTAVGVRGPAMADIERAFASVWAEAGGPLPPEEIPAVAAIAAAGPAAARVIAEEPGRMRVLQVLQLVLALAEHRVWIADAYFMAIPTLRVAMIQAARSGLDVRILLPGTNDVVGVGPLSRYGYRQFLEAGVKIWEYAGLMMHAKTTVADGWWSRIGSTNLNITGLLTNWEIDLVAEDRDFGAEMEDMFEDDLANAREIKLAGNTHRLRPRPNRPESAAERQARREIPEGRMRTSATVARVGAAALSAASSDLLQRNERMVGAAIGGGLVAFGLLVGRWPRLLGWPVSLLAGMFGGITLVRALRGQPETHTVRRLRLPLALQPFSRRRLRLPLFRKRRQRIREEEEG